MVVSVAQRQLRMFYGQTLQEIPRGAQVEWRTLDRQQNTGRRAVGVGFRDGIGKNLYLLSFQRTMGVSQQVEIAVVGQIAQGIGIALRLIVQRERAILREGVGHLHFKRAGEIFVSSRADMPKNQGVVFDLCLPYRAVKAAQAAMQAIGAVVDRQRVVDTVQVEGRAADTVATRPTNAPRYLSCASYSARLSYPSTMSGYRQERGR